MLELAIVGIGSSVAVVQASSAVADRVVVAIVEAKVVNLLPDKEAAGDRTCSVVEVIATAHCLVVGKT